MRKFLLVCIFVLFAIQSSWAVFHDFDLKENQKSISYNLIPQMNYSRQSGSLSYERGIGDNRTGEICYTSFGNWNLLPGSNTVQLSALGKQKLLEFGGLSLNGVIGIGMLYSSSLGTVFSPNLGGILGWKIGSGLKFALPVIASIYSDPGAMIDYSIGLSYSPAVFPGKHFLIGFKGILMAIADPNAMAFGNTFYCYAGLRVDL